MYFINQIHEYLQEQRSEIVDTLKMLIRIPSVRGEAVEKAPFDKYCAEILRYTEKLYLNHGFKTELDENGGYLLSFYGEGQKSLGLFAHGAMDDIFCQKNLLNLKISVNMIVNSSGLFLKLLRNIMVNRLRSNMRMEDKSCLQN